MNQTANVYEELGFKNADKIPAKSKIAGTIQRVMETRKQTQEDIGKIIGIPQPMVSNLSRGKRSGFR